MQFHFSVWLTDNFSVHCRKYVHVCVGNSRVRLSRRGAPAPSSVVSKTAHYSFPGVILIKQTGTCNMKIVFKGSLKGLWRQWCFYLLTHPICSTN